MAIWARRAKELVRGTKKEILGKTEKRGRVKAFGKLATRGQEMDRGSTPVRTVLRKAKPNADIKSFEKRNIIECCLAL